MTFYYRGKSFDNEEDFLKYVEKWPDEPVDLEYFDRLLQRLKEVIEINLKMRGTLTNREALMLMDCGMCVAEKEPQ